MQHIIGLTGLIGSGKTIVSDYFKELGAVIIDTDQIAHQLTSNNGGAIPLIIKQFGKQVINQDGSLNRQLMREMVFHNHIYKKQLEEILHPMILKHTLQQLDLVTTKQHNYIILVVPLLFKALRYLNLINRSLFIDSKESLLIKRVQKRSKLTQEQIKAILHTQPTRSLQLLLADDVIINNGDLQTLKQQVMQLDKQYSTM